MLFLLFILDIPPFRNILGLSSSRSIPFLTDFQSLLLSQPRYNLKQVGAENSGYADVAVKSKNCYYCFGVFYCEDVYYSRYSRKCVSCSGMTFCVGCEWCNECVDCANCYMTDYAQDCNNCRDCKFCKDCTGCSDCFGCAGLYQRQYCMFNEELSKEEYSSRIATLDLGNAAHRAMVQEHVEEVRRASPNIAIEQFSCEDCTGNHLSECKGCTECYDSFALEDCLYCIETNGMKNCCDLSICFEGELCYQCVHCPLGYNLNFCFHCDQCKNSEFCAFSRNLENCFGCVYVENKNYCILNVQYSPEEYAVKVEEIKQELQAEHQYNLLPYLSTTYEQQRLANESDSVIQPLIS